MIIMGPDNEILLDQSSIIINNNHFNNNNNNDEDNDDDDDDDDDEDNYRISSSSYHNHHNSTIKHSNGIQISSSSSPAKFEFDDNIRLNGNVELLKITTKMNGFKHDGNHNNNQNYLNGNVVLNQQNGIIKSNGIHNHHDHQYDHDKSNGILNCNEKEEKHCREVNYRQMTNGNSTTKNNQISTYYCADNNNKLLINKSKPYNNGRNHYEQEPIHIALLCYVSYAILIIFGYIRDFMRKTGLEKNFSAVERNREGYTPLYKSFISFYTRNIYRRIRDVWNRPIASVPGAEIEIIDRYSSDNNWTFTFPGTKSRVINMGSYNYLGYAENSGPIHEKVLNIINKNGVGICSTRNEYGHNEYVEELEQLMTRFLGVESCVVFGMGFATNSTNIQCFIGQECLIMSDSYNHASIILGVRLTNATIKIYEHNNMKDLERKIQKCIINGQPKTGKPWKKIFIIVEGIYSMEGTIVNLPELIRIKKQYKCYVYLDEAHSIGALGPNARGVIDYFGCDPSDIDILMGTFTKSFGAAGGYIAGRRELVDLIRINSFSHYYANPMSSPIAMQTSCVVRSLLGEDDDDDGRKRIKKLAHNTRYFRKKLRQMGFIIYGHDDSPVVPLLLCFCTKMAAVIRMAKEKGLGFIGAGYPATSLTTGRVRFCISAAHTKEMLDRSLNVMNEIGDKIDIKYSSETFIENNDDDDDVWLS